MVNQYRGFENEMLDTVAAADKEADFVIVSIHWGTEYTHNPDEEQIRLAQQLADAGADLIIGNHAHNIQPVEWLNDGKTLCYYAFGNAINGQDFPDYTTYDDVNTGMASSLVLSKTVLPDGTVTCEIKDVKIDLLYTWNINYEEFHSVWYKDLSYDIFPGKASFYQSMIDNVVHAYDSSFEIGLK
jgi:poly-gamma-glutamate synthesis protein (capsule biosynthesis protein)